MATYDYQVPQNRENRAKCKCRCREYTSPSLTWSKVGVVLHLQWWQEDGTLFTIDVDLNCPTWPTHTRFDAAPFMWEDIS